MKNCLIAALAVCVITLCGTLRAGEPTAISADTLSAMGLSGMQTMSDDQGLAVRGMGYAKVTGYISIRTPYISIFETKYAKGKHYAEGGFSAKLAVPGYYIYVKESGYAKAY
jgi:hypothetical protein